MFIRDLEDDGLAVWLAGGDGTWIQSDPTWGRRYALVKSEIDERFSALFLTHLGELDTVYDGAGTGLVRAGLIDSKGDPDLGPIVYDPSFEFIRAAGGNRAVSFRNPDSHCLEVMRALTAASAIEVMRASRALIEPVELTSRYPHVRLDARFAEVRQAVYRCEERPLHKPYLDLAGEISTRELIAHIENPAGGPASPLRDIAHRWASDERTLYAASVTAAQAAAERAYELELRESEPSPGRRLFDAVEGGLRRASIKNEDSVLTVEIDPGTGGQRVIKVPARALIGAALDDSLAMLPYQAVGKTFTDAAWLRDVKPHAVTSVRYGRREIYARAEQEAPAIATTAELKAALAARDVARAPAHGTSRVEAIKRKGIR